MAGYKSFIDGTDFAFLRGMRAHLLHLYVLAFFFGSNVWAEGHTFESANTLVAEIIVKDTDRNEEDAGLLSLSRSYNQELAHQAVQRLAKKLAGLKMKVLSPAISRLGTAAMRKLMTQILDLADGKNTAELVSAVSKLSNVADSQLVLNTYSGKAPGKIVAALSLTRIIEEQDGDLGLYKLATRTDLSLDFSTSAIKRIVEKLGSPQGKISKLKLLSRAEKNILVEKILVSANISNQDSVARAIVHLDNNGDVSETLKSFAGTTAGIQAAQQTLSHLDSPRSATLLDSTQKK